MCYLYWRAIASLLNRYEMPVYSSIFVIAKKIAVLSRNKVKLNKSSIKLKTHLDSGFYTDEL